jgi:hypothetical protein
LLYYFLRLTHSKFSLSNWAKSHLSRLPPTLLWALQLQLPAPTVPKGRPVFPTAVQKSGGNL